ncbi:hypothetical protein ACFRCI_37555 [Streptomyces sp. NPDC056638]|uniref:hypothetical protein n=1 Tax=Streptomyces sp. NPDC056638 TaxID=3345887 RepID=UPI0036B94B8F
MSAAPREAHASPTRSVHVDHGRGRGARAHEVCAGRTAPPRTDTARTGVVHPVPKNFRIEERQS